MTHFKTNAESDQPLPGAASHVRVAAGRAHDMIGYLAILAAALSGLGGLGVFAIAACAIALASLSYAEHHELYERAQQLGIVHETRAFLLRSFANALIATGGAYIGGYLLRLLHG